MTGRFGLPRSGVNIEGSTFVIVSNGFGDGPSQPLQRYLIERGASRVVVVAHPLLRDEAGEHRIETFEDGAMTGSRRIRLPNRPPMTFGLDLLAPPLLPNSDVLFGFNCVATAQGLAHRSVKRVRRVIHWNVDFVPDRFGPGVLTRVYDRLDASCCRHTDGRVELSEAALKGRIERYGLREETPVEVIPMGAWTADAPKANVSNLDNPTVVFLGHIVPRMGIDLLVDAMTILRTSGIPVRAEIIGGGQMLADLQARIHRLNLDDVITLHGFVEDFSEVRRLLSEAAVAVAPYDPDPTSFSRFADPGKIKAYLAAGLPILLTDVPPNAGELVNRAGAGLIDFDASQLADRILALLRSPDTWSARHRAAVDYAERFDWNILFDHGLPQLGVCP